MELNTKQLLDKLVTLKKETFYLNFTINYNDGWVIKLFTRNDDFMYSSNNINECLIDVIEFIETTRTEVKQLNKLYSI